MGDRTILYAGGFQLPDKNAAALRVISNAKALRTLGYQVVLLGVCKEKPASQDVLATRRTVEGFESYCVHYPGSIWQWVDYLQDIDGLMTMCQATRNVQAIVCYNFPSMALLKAKLFCHGSRIKLLSDCTEWYEMADVRWLYKLIKWFDTFLRMRILQKRLDGLIVISSYLERYYGKFRNVIVVPPLIDRSELKWQDVAADSGGDAIDSGDCPIKLICSGGTLGGKNKDTINHLLEAMNRFQKDAFSLQVVGLTQAEYLNDFPGHEQLLHDLGETVVFMGRVSHLASIAFVKNADFSVLLRDKSRKNDAGFPTKFVESLACGIPVISTDTSDIKKYLQDGKNGFWTQNTPDALLETLQRVASLDLGELRQMKEACRSLTVFDYHQYITEFSDLMKRIDRI